MLVLYKLQETHHLLRPESWKGQVVCCRSEISNQKEVISGKTQRKLKNTWSKKGVKIYSTLQAL